MIEDDQLWRERLEVSLKSSGLDVIAKASWIDAIRLVRTKRETITHIIADLSVGSSVDFGVDSLRLLSESSAPPTLVLTSAYMETVVKRCFSLKCVIDVVPKANRSDVETALTRLLGVEVHLTDSRQGASGERQMKTRTVFVVYGRNLKARAKVFGFLRALGLQPLEWEEAIQLTNTPSPYIGDVIDTGMRHAQAIVVLLTGDDEVRLSPDLTTPADGDEERSTQRQPRANVIFEAGVAVGRYPERTILLQLGAIKLFSDIHGRHLLRMSARPEERNVFVSKLRTAGCEVSTVGNDWLQVDIDV